MKEKESKKSRGFGFVTYQVFSNDEARELEKRLVNPRQPHTVCGRKVDVKLGDGLKEP